MKILYSLLGFILLLLVFRLLSSDGGLGEYFALQKQLSNIQAENLQLSNSNHLLKQEVQDLQSSTDSIETIARQKLGMIKENEVFVQVIELKSIAQLKEQAASEQDKPASSNPTAELPFQETIEEDGNPFSSQN